MGVLLNKESSLEAIKWITNQYVDSEISLKKGITPKETKFEVDNLVVDFFPPTSLDNLSATVLMNAKDKIKRMLVPQMGLIQIQKREILFRMRKVIRKKIMLSLEIPIILMLLMTTV